MISEGEKKYLEHAIELAEFIDQQNMTGNLKSEILDKMLIPYGLSDERKNGFQQKLMQNQAPKEQPVQQQKHSPTESVADILTGHKELEVKGDRILISKKMEREDFFDLFKEMKKRGWKYVEAKHVGGDRWEPGYFEMGATA